MFEYQADQPVRAFPTPVGVFQTGQFHTLPQVAFPTPVGVFP